MKILSTVLLLASLAVLPLLFDSCKTFDLFKPALSSAALNLLLELEDLLREYETADVAENATAGDFLVFNASQDALYRDISDLLRLSHGEIPKSILQDLEIRLGVAAARAP